jgi:GntR family transcriptional repressor for pyruvate dehydrogenase complex
MTDGLRPITVEPRLPLASEVARRLLDYLYSGAISAGDRLPSERQLSERLGVNRPAVREALRALGFLGLVEVRQSSGTYFKDPEADMLFTMFDLSLLFGRGRFLALIETRSQLEATVASLAAVRRTSEHLDELTTALARMRRAKGEEFVDADLQFHSTIVDAAGNEVLRDMLRSVRAMVRTWIGQNIRAAGSTRIAYNDHVPILEAIRDADAERARQAMSAHMVGATQRLLKANPALTVTEAST